METWKIDTESSKQICMYINVHACVFILGRNNGRKFSIDEGPHIKRAQTLSGRHSRGQRVGAEERRDLGIFQMEIWISRIKVFQRN